MLVSGKLFEFSELWLSFYSEYKGTKGERTRVQWSRREKKHVDQIQFEKAIIVILQHLYFCSIAPLNICHTKQLQVRKYFPIAKEYSSSVHSHGAAVSAQPAVINVTFYSVDLCRYSGPWPHALKSKVRSGNNVLQWPGRRCEQCTNDICIIKQEVESD